EVWRPPGCDVHALRCPVQHMACGQPVYGVEQRLRGRDHVEVQVVEDRLQIDCGIVLAGDGVGPGGEGQPAGGAVAGVRAVEGVAQRPGAETVADQPGFGRVVANHDG